MNNINKKNSYTTTIIGKLVQDRFLLLIQMLRVNIQVMVAMNIHMREKLKVVILCQFHFAAKKEKG